MLPLSSSSTTLTILYSMQKSNPWVIITSQFSFNKLHTICLLPLLFSLCIKRSRNSGIFECAPASSNNINDTNEPAIINSSHVLQIPTQFTKDYIFSITFCLGICTLHFHFRVCTSWQQLHIWDIIYQAVSQPITKCKLY